MSLAHSKATVKSQSPLEGLVTGGFALGSDTVGLSSTGPSKGLSLFWAAKRFRVRAVKRLRVCRPPPRNGAVAKWSRTPTGPTVGARCQSGSGERSEFGHPPRGAKATVWQTSRGDEDPWNNRGAVSLIFGWGEPSLRRNQNPRIIDVKQDVRSN